MRFDIRQVADMAGAGDGAVIPEGDPGIDIPRQQRRRESGTARRKFRVRDVDHDARMMSESFLVLFFKKEPLA
jgi:hypothetical protein